MPMDEKLHLEFTDVIEDMFVVPVTNKINGELTKYHEELINSGLNKDELLLKLLIKSNELVFRESVQTSTIFAQLSDDYKKQIIEKYKAV